MLKLIKELSCSCCIIDHIVIIFIYFTESHRSITMLSRSVRAETRQSRKEDIKRVMHSIDKVSLQADHNPGLVTVITRVRSATGRKDGS